MSASVSPSQLEKKYGRIVRHIDLENHRSRRKAFPKMLLRDIRAKLIVALTVSPDRRDTYIEIHKSEARNLIRRIELALGIVDKP